MKKKTSSYIGGSYVGGEPCRMCRRGRDNRGSGDTGPDTGRGS